MPSRVGAERPPPDGGAATSEKSTLSTASREVLTVVASLYRTARGPTQRSVATGSAVVPPPGATAGMNA